MDIFGFVVVKRGSDQTKDLVWIQFVLRFSDV